MRQHAQALQGDGCTDAPDFHYRDCCDEHDVHYRTHATVDGQPIEKAEADKRLFACMRARGKTPLIGKLLLPSLYWAAVRLFGSKAWSAGGGAPVVQPQPVVPPSSPPF